MKQNNKLQKHQETPATNFVPASSPKLVHSGKLLGRINHRLEKYGEKIRQTRGGNRYEAILGEYYLVDRDTEKVLEAHVSLRRYAFKYQVLGPNEKIPY